VVYEFGAAVVVVSRKRPCSEPADVVDVRMLAHACVRSAPSTVLASMTSTPVGSPEVHEQPPKIWLAIREAVADVIGAAVHVVVVEVVRREARWPPVERRGLRIRCRPATFRRDHTARGGRCARVTGQRIESVDPAADLIVAAAVGAQVFADGDVAKHRAVVARIVRVSWH